MTRPAPLPISSPSGRPPARPGRRVRPRSAFFDLHVYPVAPRVVILYGDDGRQRPAGQRAIRRCPRSLTHSLNLPSMNAHRGSSVRGAPPHPHRAIGGRLVVPVIAEVEENDRESRVLPLSPSLPLSLSPSVILFFSLLCTPFIPIKARSRNSAPRKKVKK